MCIYVGFRIDRYFCQRLSANLVDSFSRDFEESEERVRGSGGRIGWLENRFCRRVVAILLPFPLQRTDSFIFESAKIPSRIPSSNFQRVFEAQSRRVNENGRVTLSSKKSCSSREPSELFFITVPFSLLHNADRTSFVRYSMVYIYIYVYDSLLIVSFLLKLSRIFKKLRL